MNVPDSANQSVETADRQSTLTEPTTFDDQERLAELRSLDILDTLPDPRFDRYTRLIADIFKVPMVAVALIDEDRQWFKSAVGIGVSETVLEESFGVDALQHALLEIPDTVEDDRFHNHPLVVGSPFIRFYMGTVLRGPTGQPLGTLHIMDTESRYLSREQRAWLVSFGQLLQELIIHDQTVSDAGQSSQHDNHRDSVTGLPDGRPFANALRNLIRLSEKEGKYLAIMHLRLNRIDEIKNVHGRSARDAILCCLAERLIADDTGVLAAGHLSKAGFGAVIRLPSLYNLFDRITPVANKLAASIELAEAAIRPDLDIGISLSPLDGRTPEDLLERAETALDGPRSHAGVYVFSHETEAVALRRDTIAQRLESALHNNQLTNHYQPLVTVDGSRIVGFEALARWDDLDLGDVSPADFVPIAEQNARLSRMLTEWSIKAVCGEVPQRPFRPEDPPLRVAVNIPPDRFLEQGFVDRILGSLKEHGLAPERLTLELTEESILSNVDRTMQTMREFRSHGITISLDDFGTGYSSLSNLKNLPLDSLKIDKSFIDDLTQDPRAAKLVDGIIRIAHGYGLKVVAEGVEHEAQRAQLQELGCDVIQGYLFSKPMPADDALALLRRWEQTA